MSQRLRCLDTAVLPSDFHRHPFHDSHLSTKAGSSSSSFLPDIDPARPFVLYQNDLLDILGESPSVDILAKRDYAFAHEAGVYMPETDEVWFTSNLLARADGSRRVETSRIGLRSRHVETMDIAEVPMGNGACAWRGGVLFCEQGSMSTPSQLVLVQGQAPYRSQVVLNNYHGRAFNSLNDVITTRHPSGELIWFTDPSYGLEQGFRPACQLPPAVYCFDPVTGVVRMVADGFGHPNGIAFSPDGTTCYITDTSHIHGTGRLDPSLQSTIYAFDVYRPDGAPNVPSLRNRRLFAFADCGVPDGIKCDTRGNVYAGCGDGIHIWNPHGLLIGKIILGLADNNVDAGCANFCFVPGGRLVCFAEDRIYLVKGLAVEGDGLSTAEGS